MGAIPKFAPVFMVDGAVRDWEKVDFTDRETGVTRDNGRKVILLTSMGFTEVKIGSDDNAVEIPVIGERWIIFAELSEWAMNGRTGTTLTYAAPVTVEHLEGMLNSFQTPVVAGKRG